MIVLARALDVTVAVAGGVVAVCILFAIVGRLLRSRSTHVGSVDECARCARVAYRGELCADHWAIQMDDTYADGEWR